MLTNLPVVPYMLVNNFSIKPSKLRIPALANLQQAGSLRDIPVLSKFMSDYEYWTFHPEEWDIVE